MKDLKNAPCYSSEFERLLEKYIDDAYVRDGDDFRGYPDYKYDNHLIVEAKDKILAAHNAICKADRFREWAQSVSKHAIAKHQEVKHDLL